jgi:quinol monooxygenase YgiN
VYGLIGSIVAVTGKRHELVGVLLGSGGELPGCLSYIVSLDAADADRIWVTEVWESEAAHRASLSLASVRDAIAAGRPLIATIGPYTTVQPQGGIGLPSTPGRDGAASRP